MSGFTSERQPSGWGHVRRGASVVDPTGAGSQGYRRISLSNVARLDAALSRIPKGSTAIERLAREMGVSRRTLYRWRGATVHEARVGGWVATFICRPGHNGGAPVQATPWREVEP